MPKRKQEEPVLIPMYVYEHEVLELVKAMAAHKVGMAKRNFFSGTATPKSNLVIPEPAVTGQVFQEVASLWCFHPKIVEAISRVLRRKAKVYRALEKKWHDMGFPACLPEKEVKP